MKQHRSIHRNQKGIVSFFVVTIIMIVLSLIVLAFAQLVRREQRQTLDRQLSTQAFYAAESGVNDAINALNTDPSLTEWDDDCGGFTSAAGLNPDLGNGASYSCLLVDQSPPELNYSSVPTDQSVTASIRSEGDVPISALDISWEDVDGDTNINNCPDPADTNSFPGRLPGACQVGMLRLELVPFAGSRSRNDLIGDRFIAFVQPQPGGVASVSYGAGSGDQQGVKRAGGCDRGASTARYCTIRITGLPNSSQFYLRMRSVYRPTAATIWAYNGAPVEANRVNLVGAQVEIDATGRATDVLRRIKVSRAISRDGELSAEFAIQSARTQCKRFSIAPAAPGGQNLLEWYGGTGADDDECNPGD